MILSRVFFALLALGSWIGAADGAVLRVPEDYASVLAAVDAAVSGDSVLVGPGTWVDREARLILVSGTPLTITSVAFLKAGITVIGTEGAEQTVLDGGPEDEYSVDTLVHVGPGSEPVRIQGFTVTGGGKGLLADHASRIELIGCRFVANDEAAVLMGNADVAFFDSVVEGNAVSGVACDAAIFGHVSDLELRGCEIVGNAWGGIWLEMASTVIIDGCLIADHPACRGVTLIDVASLEVTNTLFLRNSVSSPATGGAMVLSDCCGLVEFCVFAYDSATAGGYGGAIAAGTSCGSLAITNNTFYACHAHNMGSAVMIGGSGTRFSHNIVAHCTGGPALLKSGGPLGSESGCNLLWANEGGDFCLDWVPADTDIFADPQFCDAAAGDYTLHSTSPAAPENSPICGLIGALGVDCGPVSIESTSWGRIKNLYR